MKPEIQPLIAIRLGVETDHNFIFATWLRGLYYGNTFFRFTEKDEFMERYTYAIQNALYKPSVEIRIACLKEDPDVILGYSVLELLDGKYVLHWVFVKPEWRKSGIAEAMIPDDLDTITHVVDSICSVKVKKEAKSDKWLSNYDVKLKNKKLKFKPFLF